ncbi:MAG: hypothetical protein CMH36_03870 [Microbacterium sp.]|uniref:Uncharacterized protein n=1 Tax=Microbacterium ginsengisoli TaxID=400772 RepID=A0A3C1KG00_9MICO|nr:hypothetical protein [Microbacterium sp.]HAN25388.1 hypothetical protein [Microbacterium ginsengisoli]
MPLFIEEVRAVGRSDIGDPGARAGVLEASVRLRDGAVGVAHDDQLVSWSRRLGPAPQVHGDRHRKLRALSGVEREQELAR